MNKLTSMMLKKPQLMMSAFNFRMFGVLEDMESKLQKQFNPTALKVSDPNGDLYKVNVNNQCLVI